MVILWVLKSESRTDYYYHRAWNVISKAAYTRMFTNYLLNCSGVCSLAVACVCEAAAVLFWESVDGHHDQNRKTGSKGGELWCLKLFSCWSWVMRFFSAQSSKTIGCNILKKCTEVLSGHALLLFFILVFSWSQLNFLVISTQQKLFSKLQVAV